MKKKLIFSSAVLLLFNTLPAQGFSANLGYDYIGKNALYFGLDYRLNANSTGSRGKNIGLGSYVTFNESQTEFIPNIHYMHPIGNLVWEMQLTISTKNISPSFGANVFNGLSLNAGYNFAFREKSFQGPYLGFHFMLGGKQFYDQMKFF